MLEKIDDTNNESIVFGGDFNLFFEAKSEKQRGSPVLKKKSLAKLMQIKQSFDLCDRYLKNKKLKHFIFTLFCQQHSSNFGQRRFDFF